MTLPPTFSVSRWLGWAALVLGCTGCFSWQKYDLRVPVGTRGGFPAYVGRTCEAARRGEGAAAITVEAETSSNHARWHAGSAGSLRITCEKARARLVSVPVGRVWIELQSHLRLGDKTLTWLEIKAEDRDGEEIDLSLVDSDQLHWIVPEGIYSRGPSCGHMVPLCAGGSIGNGRSLRVEFAGESPVRVRARIGPPDAPLYEATLDIPPAPATK
jgi:hypothetical protein